MNNELLKVATQAIEYLKEAGIKKPHFIKHAEEVIKASKKGENEMQKISKHFDSYLSINEGMNYTKIYAALKKALAKNPDMLVEDVQVDIGGSDEVRTESIALIEDLEFTTVGRFCDMCGITL